MVLCFGLQRVNTIFPLPMSRHSTDIVMVRKITFFLFITVVLLAPFPFASNRPWSWSLLSFLIGLLIILEGLTSRDSPEVVRRFLIRVAPGLFLMGFVNLWAWFQTMTILPADIVHPLWFEAAALIGTPTEGTISLDPVATKTSLMRLLAYSGVFWIAARFCRDPKNAAMVLRTFVIASGIYALYGLVIFFADLKMILWFEKWAYQNDLTSTFVNRNTYATFAGLGLIAAAALNFDLIGNRLPGHLTGRKLTRAFAEWAFSQAWLPVVAMLLSATALLLTHSRGGFLSTSLAIFVLLVTLIYAKLIPRKIGYALVCVVIFGSSFAFTMSGDIVVKRLVGTSLESSIRDEVYERVIEAIPSSPILGTGYGTFQQAFMAYKTPELSLATWDKAHSSYLELAMELGIPMTIAIVVLFLWLGGVCLYGVMRRRRRKVYAAIGLSATVLVAAHAVVDFSLQIPGFAVSYALLMGLAWAQSWTTQQRVG